MKRFLLLLIFPSLAFGQPGNTELSLSINTVDPFLPLGNLHIEDKFLAGGNYNNSSFALGFAIKYFVNQNNAVRFRLTYTNRSITDVRDMTTTMQHRIDDYDFTQTLLKLSPAFQWTFTEDKITFFGGLDLPVTVIGEMTAHSYVMVESLDGTSHDEYWTVQKIPGGTSVGPGVFLGSNYFFTEHIAFGFEFGMAYLYTSVGGLLASSTDSDGTSGSATVIDQHEETIKQMKFSPVQGGISVTVKF
jgi:hypothetical protein